MKYTNTETLPRRTSPHWNYTPESGHYTTTIEQIGDDILYCRIVTETSVELETFEKPLLELVISESGLENRPLFIIWDLTNVTSLSHNYKRGIVNLLYNLQLPLSGVIFFNIPQELALTAKTIAAILPSGIPFRETVTLEHALMLAEELRHIPGKPEPAEDNDTSIATLRFLAATARIGWMHMYDTQILMPPEGHDTIPFFECLADLQKTLHESSAAQPRTGSDDQSVNTSMRLDEQGTKKRQLLATYEQHKAEIFERIKERTRDIERASSSINEQRGPLRDLYEMVRQSDADTASKKRLIRIIDNLIETELNEKKIDMPLTSTDSGFLTLLQQKHPNLNKRELKICLMIKLSYDTDEIARNIDISRRGMESIRYRMHKKLRLSRHQSIKNYLAALNDTLDIT